MQNLEKRAAPRQTLQIQVRFHCSEMEASDPEIASETFNISPTGLFMRSPLRLKPGDRLALTLRIPTYLSGSPRSDVQCTGRVVHERRLPTGELGYGIHFEQMLNFQPHPNFISAPLPSTT
jgi:hypothetical protein